MIGTNSPVPAIASLQARETLRIGIRAVVISKWTPGIKLPMNTGKMMTIFNGAIILWASLNDFA